MNATHVTNRKTLSPRSRLSISIILMLLPALLFLLAGCNTGADDTGSESGMVVLGLTDAKGDYTTYTVDVMSLTLTKANGTVVDTLPLETTVDFAQYTEMTEFLTVATIPTGLYTKAEMTLSYENADIQVEDEQGNSKAVVSIQDENGNPIQTLQVSVYLEGRNALFIRPGVPAHLTLDFDLKASNHVEFDPAGDPVLTVEPVLLADLNPEAPKIHRLRGPLDEVDVDAGTFDIVIRPFRHVMSGGNSPFGTLTVVGNAATVYDINGDQLQGDAGLELLSAQTPLTAVIVIGDLNIGLRRFEARQVFAGSSVPGGTLDVVTGNVIQRTNDLLTVKGATLIRSDGSVVFNDTLAVQVDAGTRVSRQLSTADYTVDDISVGQRIRVFGDLNQTETELDASQGAVHMLITTVKGTVVQAASSSVVLQLTGIDGRRIDLFDFSGTGLTPADDADPDNYDIGTDPLDTSGLDVGDPVKIRGFVSSFGHASGEEDFAAQTLINVADVPAVMVVTWHPASNDAVAELAVDGFSLDLNGSVLFHHVWRAGVAIDLADLAAIAGIVPRGDGNGIYSIVQSGSRRVDFTFAGFADELSQRLDANTPVRRIVARGLFDDPSATLTADWVTVALE